MNERLVVVVMQPRARLHDALCERTCDLARYLDGIERAELESRETTPEGIVRCVHRWRARANVPALLEPHVDAGFLEWIGRTEWREGDYRSRWLVEPLFLGTAALCEGTIACEPAVGGRGTRVEIELAITGVQVPSGAMRLTGSVLATHFRKLVDAATRLVAEASS